MVHKCVICFKHIHNNYYLNMCNYAYCNNGICNECTPLCDINFYINRKKHQYCSLNCIISTIGHYQYYFKQYINSISIETYEGVFKTDKSCFIINEQNEIYEEIMIKNRYKYLVEIYPIVLAKIISKY